MFHKQGAPQPFEILKMSMGTCEICGQKQAVVLVNGKKVCESCKEQANSTEN
jgi:hypothetical protein